MRLVFFVCFINGLIMMLFLVEVLLINIGFYGLMLLVYCVILVMLFLVNI